MCPTYDVYNTVRRVWRRPHRAGAGADAGAGGPDPAGVPEVRLLQPHQKYLRVRRRAKGSSGAVLGTHKAPPPITLEASSWSLICSLRRGRSRQHDSCIARRQVCMFGSRSFPQVCRVTVPLVTHACVIVIADDISAMASQYLNQLFPINSAGAVSASGRGDRDRDAGAPH